MKILITGGAGFVGSSLARSLADEGHMIYIVDNMFTGRPQNLSGISQLMFFELDLSDPVNIPFIDSLIKDCDLVYHMAASIGVKLVQEKPKETFRNSTQINDNLFPLFEKYNKKVIFTSTSEVYGETKNGTGSAETDHLEIHPVQKPRGSYACSKLFAEFQLRSYNFPSVIVRFFNIVGPSQVGDYGHVLPKFIDAVIAGDPIPVHDSGQMVRSFCDIRDAVEMLKILIDNKHNGEVYNIGNSENICTMNELAEAVNYELGGTSKIKHIPFKEALGDQFDEIFVRFPNTDKIQKYYKCKYNLKDIIRNIYDENFSYSSAS